MSCGATDAGESVGVLGRSRRLNSETSQALEQVGTSADCNATTGSPTYYAWYELVPDHSVTIKLKVHPGDTITTSVNVLGGDDDRAPDQEPHPRHVFTTKLPFANPDLSSAEWIAEAPSACDQYRCQPDPALELRYRSPSRRSPRSGTASAAR